MNELIPYHPTTEGMVQAWLAEKQRSKSGSAKTALAYRTTMQSFREALAEQGLDVDADPRDIIPVAQAWAARRSPAAKSSRAVSASTYNQRLAIISSFYAYLNDQAQVYNKTYPNPIESIKRPKVQAHAEATPLDADVVFDQLLSIDRSSLRGKRDYALLAIGLQTGRRAAELVGLRMKHVQRDGEKITLHFDQCGGGQKMYDTLDPDTAAVFLDYLHAAYGADLLQVDNGAPVWVSLSRQNRGQPISVHTLIDICERHLQVSKIRALRHTYAVEMLEADAPIKHRLGHENLATTSIYTKRLRSATNPYATKLSARFGIGKRRME